MKYASVIVLCVFAAVSFGGAISVTYDTADTMQPNPWQDTWVWTGSGPYGSDIELRINNESTYDQRPVLEWDLDDIEDATINSAIFYVYRYQGMGALDADIYRVTESWEEATLVAPAPTYDDTSWANGGAGDPNGWKTFDITDLVQGWVDGDFDNYGIICLGTSGAGYYQRWYSKESGSNKPYLDIDYETGPQDITPPFVEGMDPDDGEVDVPLDSAIVFHCVDREHDVVLDTIDFTVRDTSLRGDRMVSTGPALGIHHSPARTLPGTLELDDTDPLDVLCTWTGADDFYEGETITCTVAAGLADSRDNEMEEDFVWTFDTIPIAVEDTTWGVIKTDF